jgi:hypothetical protein
MPIIMTPVTTPDVTAINVVQPEVSKVEGIPNPGRMQAIQVNQGEAPTVFWTFRDSKGNPLNLSNVSIVNP